MNEVWSALEGAAVKRIQAQGISREQVELERFADIRYTLQVNQVPVKAPAGIYAGEDVATLARTFETEYERLFGQGSGYADAGLLLTAMRVRARARVSDFTLSRRGTADSGEAPPQKADRGVIWYERGLDRESTPIYDGDRFGPGMQVRGPAIVEFTDTTLVLRHGQEANVDDFGSVTITI
jgi:N-methylhydantoinase A